MDLDIRRPFGTIHGTGPIHKYEQDGKLFDSEGMWIHKDGTRVTPKEKVAAAHRELEEHNRKKKIEIDKKIREFELEEQRLQKEAQDIIYREASKLFDKLEQPLSFFNSTEKVKDALDLVGFQYDPDAKYSELKEHLSRIFDAAHG